MPVSPVAVVGDQHLRADLADNPGQRRGRLVEIRLPQAARIVVSGRADHAAVTPPTRPTEEAVVVDTERRAGARQLADAVPAELVAPVRPQIDQLGDEHLAHLPECAGDEGDVSVGIGGVGRHGHPSPDHLVVGVGVHEQHPPRRQISGVRPGLGRRSGSSHIHDPTGRYTHR